MAFDARILADSISPVGHRLTTFQFTFPRIVLAEVNTHRMLARNSASSRATPVEKRIASILEDPFFPAAFGKNKKGMQADEHLEGSDDAAARSAWQRAMEYAISCAKELSGLGVHKQLANRLIEPFSWHTAIATGTDWDNFFHLRCHKDAQPEFSTVAHLMQDLYRNSKPRQLEYGQWHLPLLFEEDEGPYTTGRLNDVDWDYWCRISVGRCARVSYLTHDGRRDHQEDINLFTKLVGNAHLSPLEHVGRAMTLHELKLFGRPRYVWDSEAQSWEPLQRNGIVDTTHYLGAFNGWVSRRAIVPGEYDILGPRWNIT